MAEQPMVMGIVNVTPDSFYSSSRHMATDEIIHQTDIMVSEGADIIDLGAQSTRPGSELISQDEEIERLSGLIEKLAVRFPEIIISVDTFYSEVAKRVIDQGATMINDISGGMMDEKMLATIAALKVPYVCMHMRGTPQTMNQYTNYDDVTVDVIDYFIKRINDCRQAGIQDIIIDPGFGFSKNIAQNFEMLKRLNAFKILGKPLLVGLSRKSTVYKTLNINIEDALNGTTVLNTAALLKGADILRVHDVKEAKECIKLCNFLV